MILKRKYRYVLVLTSRDIDVAMHGNAITTELTKFMGEIPYSRTNPRIVAQYTPRLFVFKTNRGFESHLILALSFVKQVGGAKIGFWTVKTSGTIKSLLIYARELKE